MQHERGAHGGIYGRVRAGKHQGQTLVGDGMGLRLCVVNLINLVNQQKQLRGVVFLRLALARGVDQAVPRCRQQPGLRRSGHTLHRPMVQGGLKGVSQGVFSTRHVVRAC